MGNTACCQAPPENPNGEVIVPSKMDKEPEVLAPMREKIEVPQLSEAVRRYLIENRPFQDKQKQSHHHELRKFEKLIYEGELNQEGQPNGYGKMYYPNGSFFVGHFKKGLADGQGHYIFPDGSFYRGKMENNFANDPHAEYQEKDLKFKGPIVHNQIGDGQGTLRTEKGEFKGTFAKGKPYNGVLEWKEVVKDSFNDQLNQTNSYLYDGFLDEEGRPHGKGTLKGPLGTYIGTFEHGLKSGQGRFSYKSNVAYEGDYKNDKKNGNGTLFGADGKISYCGEFKDGLPHGKGYIPLPDGTKNNLEFVQGISVILQGK